MNYNHVKHAKGGNISSSSSDIKCQITQIMVMGGCGGRRENIEFMEGGHKGRSSATHNKWKSEKYKNITK